MRKKRRRKTLEEKETQARLRLQAAEEALVRAEKRVLAWKRKVAYYAKKNHTPKDLNPVALSATDLRYIKNVALGLADLRWHVLGNFRRTGRRLVAKCSNRGCKAAATIDVTKPTTNCLSGRSLRTKCKGVR